MAAITLPNLNQPENFNQNGDCSICLEPIHDQLVRVNSCWHRFHRNCITIWLAAGHRTCPNCRQRIIDLRVPLNARANDLGDEENQLLLNQERVIEIREIANGPNAEGDDLFTALRRRNPCVVSMMFCIALFAGAVAGLKIYLFIRYGEASLSDPPGGISPAP